MLRSLVGSEMCIRDRLSIKRAGADIIITYFAEEFARLYRQGGTGAV